MGAISLTARGNFDLCPRPLGVCLPGDGVHRHVVGGVIGDEVVFERVEDELVSGGGVVVLVASASAGEVNYYPHVHSLVPWATGLPPERPDGFAPLVQQPRASSPVHPSIPVEGGGDEGDGECHER